MVLRFLWGDERDDFTYLRNVSIPVRSQSKVPLPPSIGCRNAYVHSRHRRFRGTLSSDKKRQQQQATNKNRTHWHRSCNSSSLCIIGS
jgi:hypothetical protein